MPAPRYSDKIERFTGYIQYLKRLPLKDIFVPPTFSHPVVLAAWKQVLSFKLANCSDEEVAALSRTASRADINNLVQRRTTNATWDVVLKHCKHKLESEDVCARCRIERDIARQAIIDAANLIPQDVFAPGPGDWATATIWAYAAETCNRCSDRNYIACICQLDKNPNGRIARVLRDWSQGNCALKVDIGYRNHYIDFMMRHVLYDKCDSCTRKRSNLELPFNKRICLCDLSPRSRYVFNTLINDLGMESAKLDVSSAYTIIENMVANFKYNVVKDGELVIQE